MVDDFKSASRMKLARKKRMLHVKKFSTVRPEGRLSLEQAETKAVLAKAAWTGGLTARKNVPEEWSDE